MRLKRPRQTDEDYCRWIAEQSCIICRRKPVQVCHLRIGDLSWGKPHQGWGRPSDHWVNPMCPEHHDEQHKIGEEKFQLKYSVSLFKTALALSHSRYDDEMAEHIIEGARK